MYSWLIHLVVVYTAGEPLYPRLLNEIIETNSYNINIDCANLHRYRGCGLASSYELTVSLYSTIFSLRSSPPSYDPHLYSEVVMYPSEIIPALDLVVHQMIQRKHPQADRSQRTQVHHLDACMCSQSPVAHRPFVIITLNTVCSTLWNDDCSQVRLFNLVESSNMRELDPQDIDKLISLKGMVIRCSQILPDLRAAFFKCALCGFTKEVTESGASCCLVAPW